MNAKGMFETVKITVEEKLGSSVITQDLLDDETIGPIIVEEHRKAYQERNRANPPINLLHRFKGSIFQDS